MEGFELQTAPERPQATGNTVALDNFEGPLDLLVFLIKKNDVNIYDIPIAQITEQFLEYLDYATEVDLANLTDFYAMAADLIYIKARMLLPVEADFDDDEAEDPRQALVEKLIEYQKYKKLSGLMAEQEALQDWNLEREKLQRVLPFEDTGLWEKVDTWDLLQDMQQLFKRLVTSASSERILDLFEEVSVNEKITLIQELLDTKGECFLTDLIARAGSLMDAVCAFMAILEAVKLKTVSIYQNRLFGDIKICPYQAA
ncbi:MAG: segregation/condensation protein A [Treponema sp.]|jgi:segregation and condensation protein A|nr:segregation/condensation protein A [Treponema sp.]